MSQKHCQLYEEHKSGSSNCDITFGFSISKFDPNHIEMETDDIVTDCEKSHRITVHAHKKVLRDASPIFDMLLVNQWNVPGPVEVSELTAAQFIKFLGILYLAKVEEVITTEEVLALYGFAVKYRCEKTVLLLTNYVMEKLFGSVDTKAFVMLFESIATQPNPLLEEACLEFASKFTQTIIESEDFLQATPGTIETIYKLDIMNIANELYLVKALERYVLEHEKQGRLDVKAQLKRAISSIRFHILEEQQILDTILLTEEEKMIFVSVLKDETKFETLPINFTRKTRNRYDARFVIYSSLEVFNLMTNFYRCNSSECSNVVCPSFANTGSDLPELLPDCAQKYYEIMTKLKFLQNRYNSNQGGEKVVEEILHLLQLLQYCFAEGGEEVENKSDSSTSGDAVLTSQSSEDV